MEWNTKETKELQRLYNANIWVFEKRPQFTEYEMKMIIKNMLDEYTLI